MVKYEEMLAVINTLRLQGANHVKITAESIEVSFAIEQKVNMGTAAIVNDLIKQDQKEDDEDVLYWSAGG